MAELREERRIVTAMFADVVGSTALSERLDPEEAKLVIGEAVGRAVTAVETYGGTIGALAGDGLLALFGAPIAHEDDPERAVRAALDIIASIREYAEEVRRGFNLDFSMRVGIHTGEVVVGKVGAGSRVEYSAMGDTVNSTARLQAAAAPAGVLVSDATRRQVQPLFDWGPPVTLELKGKSTAMVAYSVLSPIEGTGTRTVVEPTAPMVGRDSELAVGLELIERLDTGSGGVFFIIGEPGIGKSRLAAELRQRAAERNLTWLDGRCVSYGDALPYWPYRDLLRNWLDVSATDPELRVRVKLRRKAEESFPGHALEVYPYLGTILGLTLESEASVRLQSLSPESLQYRTFEVVTELLSHLAGERPLVIALDDLHWADPTSLALTERVLEIAESAPVMLMISHRPETDHPSWLLREKAAREYRHLFREVALQPLARNSEAALLSSLTGDRVLPEDLADRLLGFAEGNPFYLEQMVRSLIDSGALVPENGRWKLTGVDSLEVPPTLEGVIIARIDRLQPEWREVVTSASVLGRTFGLELLQAVSGLELPQLRQAVHHLLRLDLLREESAGRQPVYRFKHALIQETAYRTLVTPRRALLHRRAAEWYESYYGKRPERVYGLIAHHWIAAADYEKAVASLKLAGDRALSEWALDEAAGHYRQLIPLLMKAGRQQDASELLFQLATTLHMAMRYRETNEAWKSAFARWSPPANANPVATATLRIGVNQMPWVVDPFVSMYSTNVRVQVQLYDRLMTPRPGPYMVPGLAEWWEVSDDGLRYVMRLKPGLQWNDGRPLTAHDVVWNYLHLLEPPNPSTEAIHLFLLENAQRYARGELSDAGAVGVKALDARTLEFRLGEPSPRFIWLFGYPLFGAVRPDLEPSGAFRVVSLEADRVVIERNLGYQRRHGGNVARAEWVPAVAGDAVAALRRGELDVIAPSVNWVGLREAETAGVEMLMGAPVATVSVIFGGGRADAGFRHALAHATDRAGLQAVLLPNQAVATGGLVPPGLPGHTPDIARPFDPDQARSLLAQSSHRSPFRLFVATEQRGIHLETLVGGWQDVLRMPVEIIERPIRENMRFSEIADAILWNWIAGWPDPEYYLTVLLHSRSSSNIFRWKHQPFDDLVERASAERNGAARLALFHRADRMVVEELSQVIPVVYGRGVALLQPWVQGWWEWGVPWLSLDDLAVDERSPRYRPGPIRGTG